ncbi:MAG: hypothetical protein WC441_05425 [Patescibacteria group bacterium]
MATLHIADAADLVDRSIQKIFLKGSKDESRDFEQYFNTEVGITDYYIKDSSMSGLGYASRILENAVITSETPVQGYDKTYTQVEYGKVLPVTKRMWKFGIKKRDLERIANELRKACSDLRELRCGDRIDQMHATSYTASDDSGNYTISTTGGDGKAFIATDHTREDGGTDVNNQITDGSTVNMDFAYDALQAAHRTAAIVRNPKGKKMNISLDTLVVTKGYTNYFAALEILGAINRQHKPASNAYDGSGIPVYKIIATPWITTNVNYWSMFDSGMKGMDYGFQYKESQPIQLEGPNVVFKTGEIQYKATVMFDIGHNDSRGWVGSNNTNA